MQLAYPPTYLSRVISLPAAVAADALDRVRSAGALDPTVRTEPSEWLSIPAAAGTLQLAREDAPDHPARILPVRQVPGRLRTRLPWPTVAVELELTPWSTGRTEVGLRYQSPLGRRSLRLYHTICGEALGSSSRPDCSLRVSPHSRSSGRRAAASPAGRSSAWASRSSSRRSRSRCSNGRPRAARC